MGRLLMASSLYTPHPLTGPLAEEAASQRLDLRNLRVVRSGFTAVGSGPRRNSLPFWVCRGLEDRQVSDAVQVGHFNLYSCPRLFDKKLSVVLECLGPLATTIPSNSDQVAGRTCSSVSEAACRLSSLPCPCVPFQPPCSLGVEPVPA